MEQVHSPRALLEQKREQRVVGLGGVARNTREDEVVGSIVRGLAATRAYVIEGDHIRRGRLAAIGADWAMALKKPLAVGLEGPPWGPLKRGGTALRGTFSRRSSTHKNSYWG